MVWYLFEFFISLIYELPKSFILKLVEIWKKKVKNLKLTLNLVTEAWSG